MTILIVYATNSGSTAAVAQHIAETLSAKNHTITVKQASEMQPEELWSIDGIILGTPSWDYEGKEGQPHEDMTKFLSSLKSDALKDKKVAIFGLGDSNYTHFCGAVEIVEQTVQALGGKLITSSLKVDQYYAQPNAIPLITSWTEKLATNIT